MVLPVRILIQYQSFHGDKILITRNCKETERTFTPHHRVQHHIRHAYMWIHENEVMKNRSSSYPLGHLLSIAEIKTIINL